LTKKKTACKSFQLLTVFLRLPPTAYFTSKNATSARYRDTNIAKSLEQLQENTSCKKHEDFETGATLKVKVSFMLEIARE